MPSGGQPKEVRVDQRNCDIDDTIKYINELIEIDRIAIAALIANRVPCNQQLADHSTVQVYAQHGGYLVGMLGILNGLFGICENGLGPIVFIFKDGNLMMVGKTEEYEITTRGLGTG